MSQVPLLAPQAGQDLPSVKVVEWRKKAGDTIKKGEIVLVVESEKAVIEVDSPCDGILGEYLVKTGEDAKVLEAVAMIESKGGAPSAVAQPKPVPVEAPKPATKVAPILTPPPVEAPAPRPLVAPVPGQRIIASPLAKREAQKRGISLVGVQGTGPNGRIKLRDLPPEGTSAQTLPTLPPAPDFDRVEMFDKMRTIIAGRLTTSWQTIPHFHLDRTVDCSAALAKKAALAAQGVKVSITDLIVHALAQALRHHPRCNGHVESDKLVLKARVNIGLAVALPGGLVVPVIPDADRLDITEIARETKFVAQEAKAGRIRMRPAGTCTVTNLGAMGVERFNPIINPPEAIILAVGALRQDVVAIDGMIGIRPRCTLTLGADHRAIDGAEAAKLLATMDLILQQM